MEDLELKDPVGVNLYRTYAVIMDLTDFANSPMEFRWKNPVPVLSSDHNNLLGSGVITQDGQRLVAEITIPYETPERLDIENREKIWALPNVHFRSFVLVRDEEGLTWRTPSIGEVRSITIRKDCADPTLPTIGYVL